MPPARFRTTRSRGSRARDVRMARSASSGLNPQVMPVWPHRSFRGLRVLRGEVGTAAPMQGATPRAVVNCLRFIAVLVGSEERIVAVAGMAVQELIDSVEGDDIVLRPPRARGRERERTMRRIDVVGANPILDFGDRSERTQLRRPRPSAAGMHPRRTGRRTLGGGRARRRGRDPGRRAADHHAAPFGTLRPGWQRSHPLSRGHATERPGVRAKRRHPDLELRHRLSRADVA